MPGITSRDKIGKILIFTINERVFSKLENIFDIISGKNISHEFHQMDGYGTVCEPPLYL